MTFKDDPLRVLRCFRFKSRFDFAIDKLIYQSLENKVVHEALKTKVSKERIGIELSGMLKAQHPLKAMEEILRFGFWNIVFQVPEGSDLKDHQFIDGIPQLGYKLLETGMQSIHQNELRTEQVLLETEVKDKRIRYSSEDLKVLV